ncbi:FAD-dependent pyridine nucleotide-disulfide oxidoreductase [Purpureocillium lavendulum]|uniref:FAD-dependent pyridine nucleotide-disulfide oxidoreductase n=1 Tax=Purpureocillium lavendulum TaxID=1247861 RepID=A0AB34G0N1_9HYPO|nr:FAD-dependent pyridine nucleotide-disulfide oxidoreductase [Purpureocillium lavendulum]
MAEQRLLIIGAGFAGLWSAMAARRLIDVHKDIARDRPIQVTVVAPEPELVLRPRLYEANVAEMRASLVQLFEATDVQFVAARVGAIRPQDGVVDAVDRAGAAITLPYDRLVLAPGSQLARPNIPGLREHAFTIDQIAEAVELEDHLKHLTSLPPTTPRNTIVVCGGGFTGIELAAELPERLAGIFGKGEAFRIVIVERADVIGPELGSNPRPFIASALGELGVEMKLGSAVASIDEGGVTLADGERIDALTAVWTAGMEASPLTKQVAAPRDGMGRLQVDRNLRIPELPGIFVAGDAASVVTKQDGHLALQSCQHALRLGRAAGHNAAADLLGVDGRPYEQLNYGTCLDLGSWGSLITDGWDRQVHQTGLAAKPIKKFINQTVIYPPPPNAAAAYAAADPADDPPPVKAFL